MPLDLTALHEAELLRGALRGPWPPAVLRACRRALPRLLALPGTERLEFLRATAAAEEPEALAALDAAGPGTWVLAWETGERPTAFHVCPARHDGPVRAVAVGEFGSRTFVASGGDDHVVRLRDAFDQSGPDLEGLTASVRALAFGVVNGRPALAGGDRDGTIRTWDPLTGARGFARETTAGHPSALAFVTAEGGRVLLAVAIGYDDDEIPAAEQEGRVELRDPVTGELVRELRVQWDETMLDLAVAKLGERTVLASLGYDTLYVWDPATGERLGSAGLNDVWPDLENDGFAPPLLVGVWNGRPEIGVVVRIEHPPDYTVQSREAVYLNLENLGDRARGRGFDRDQGPVAMTTHARRNVMLVANHTDTGRAWERPAKAVITYAGGGTDVHLDADTRLITAAAFGSLEGGLCLATAGLDGTVQLWDAQTPHEHRRIGYGGSGLALFTTAQGAPALAVGTHSDTVLVVDAASGEKIGSVGCRPFGEVDGRVLLAAGAEVWDPVTQERVDRMPRWGFAERERLRQRRGPAGA